MTEPTDFKVVLATRNQGKIKEIMAIFQDVPIEFLTLDTFPDCPEVIEDAPTLEGNAQKKPMKSRTLPITSRWPMIPDWKWIFSTACPG